jgi:YVTN family beta-propeller protein
MKRIDQGVGAYAQHIALTSDGKRGYVATDWWISVIDTTTDTVIDYIPLEGVSYTTLSPDGNWLFATYNCNNPYAGSFAKINAATGYIEARVNYTPHLTSAVVSQDGARLYVSSQSDNRIYIFSTDTLGWEGWVEGAHGLRMLLSRDGTRLYVTNNTGNLLQVIDTGTNSVINSIPIAGPVGLALTSDESRLLVSCDLGVAVIDLASQSQSVTKYLGGFTQPKEIAILAGPEVAEVLQVAIDIRIKPGGHRNPINLKSKGKVPVAILSDATFDAATVDPSTVVFAGASPRSIGTSLEDVSGDGLLDMVLHFRTQDLTLQPGDTEACLSGQTTNGQAFTGCDSVHIIKWEEHKRCK